MTGALSSDAGLVPKLFVAVVAQTYACPLVSPKTVMGEVGLSPNANVSP